MIAILILYAISSVVLTCRIVSILKDLLFSLNEFEKVKKALNLLCLRGSRYIANDRVIP